VARFYKRDAQASEPMMTRSTRLRVVLVEIHSLARRACRCVILSRVQYNATPAASLPYEFACLLAAGIALNDSRWMPEDHKRLLLVEHVTAQRSHLADKLIAIGIGFVACRRDNRRFQLTLDDGLETTGTLKR